MAGLLVPMGGAIHNGRGRDCLEAFCVLAGRRVVVLPAASRRGNPLAWYTGPFAHFGVEVLLLPMWSVADANEEHHARVLREAEAVFILGGSETYLYNTLSGTRCEQALRQAHREGAVVGGTSAGAMYLGQWAIEDVVHEAVETGERAIPPLAQLDSVNVVYEGSSLAPRWAFDVHFSQRHHLPRLRAFSRLVPSAWCLGIDEDTAAVLDGNRIVSVVGEGDVYLVHGGEVVAISAS